MPSALQFVGGGLLEGVGKGLAEQARETGKAKRERVLADLEHKRALERDEARFKTQRGLLGTRIGAQEDAAELLSEQRIDASEVATGVATTTAENLATSQKELEKLRQKNRLKLKGATTTDTSAADSRILDDLKDIHTKTDPVLNIKVPDWAAISAAIAAMPNASPGLKALGKEAGKKGKGLTVRDLDKGAEAYADRRVDEESFAALPDFIDFRKFGGSRTKAHAFYKREYIALQKGEAPPTLAPTKPAAKLPTRPEETQPVAPPGEPYTGEIQPPGFPNARRSSRDGFWYIPDPARPDKFKRVNR